MQDQAVVEKPALALMDTPQAQPVAVVPQGGPVTITPAVMLQRAVAQGADVALMERLWNLHVTYEAHEARKVMNDAFAQFKSEAIEIIKAKHVSYRSAKTGALTEYDHEELIDVVEAVTPALSKYGLSISWRVASQARDWVVVECTLKHAAGASESVELGAAPDDSGGKNSIQAIGSAITYLERYTAKAILGVAAKGQDDDGRGGKPPAAATEETRPEQQQISELAALIVQGNEAAKGGMAKLTTWWGSVPKRWRGDRDLNRAFGAMRKVAGRV